MCNFTVPIGSLLSMAIFPFNDSKYPKIAFFGLFLANFGYLEFWDMAKTLLVCVILLCQSIPCYLWQFFSFNDSKCPKIGFFGLFLANFGYLEFWDRDTTLLVCVILLCQSVPCYKWQFLSLNYSKYPKIGFFGLFLANFGYLEFWDRAKTLLGYVILLCKSVPYYLWQFLSFNDLIYTKTGYFGLFCGIFAYPKFWDRAETLLENVIQLCQDISWSFKQFLNFKDEKKSKNGHLGPKKVRLFFLAHESEKKMSYPFSTPFVGPICKNLEIGHCFFSKRSIFCSEITDQKQGTFTGNFKSAKKRQKSKNKKHSRRHKSFLQKRMLLEMHICSYFYRSKVSRSKNVFLQNPQIAELSKKNH